MVEIWIPIEGFEGSYEVSNLGRVRSLDRVVPTLNRWGGITDRRYNGCILPCSTNKVGYVSVVIGGFGRFVHRLVAQSFIPNPLDLPEANHKDGVRNHNSEDNLEWVTSTDNKLHSYRKLNRKEHAWKAAVRLTAGENTMEFPSALAAAKHLDVDHGSVLSALKRNHRCRGYRVEII